MKRRRLGVLVLAAVGGTVGFLWAQENQADRARDLPPCVVKAEPADRSTDVDPKLTEIKVTYDRPMMDKSWSWIIHDNLGKYPGSKELGEPRWENDGKTCVLPVQLQPDTVYAVGCNSFRHTGFRDRTNRVAVPYVWVFRTRPAGH